MRQRKPVLLLLAIVLFACGPSARETTIRSTYDALIVTRDTFAAWDIEHQRALVAASKSKDEATAKTTAYEVGDQAHMKSLLVAAFSAVGAALLVNNDQSLATLLKAAQDLKTAYDAIQKVSP
jgi:hypothetical protein